MKKLFVFLFIFLLLLNLFPASNKALAATCTASYSPTQPTDNKPLIVSVFHAPKANYKYNVFLKLESGGNINPDKIDGIRSGEIGDETVTYTFSKVPAGKYTLAAVEVNNIIDCLRTQIIVQSSTQGNNSESTSSCTAWIGDKPGETPIIQPGDNITFHASGQSFSTTKSYSISVDTVSYGNGFTISQNPNEITFPFTTASLSNGTHVVSVQEAPDGFLATLYKAPKTLCSTTFAIGYLGAPTEAPKTPKIPCFEKDANGKCIIATAIGPISTGTTSFIENLFKILLGFAGGIATLLIIAAGYKLMTSQGEAEKIKEARESLTSAIVGLLFIIFSLVILQIIGADILKIPGFGA